MTGNYGPAAAAAAAAAAGNTTGRTVYVGNLPPDASVDELMNLVRFGPVESVRLLPRSLASSSLFSMVQQLRRSMLMRPSRS